MSFKIARNYVMSNTVVCACVLTIDLIVHDVCMRSDSCGHTKLNHICLLFLVSRSWPNIRTSHSVEI